MKVIPPPLQNPALVLTHQPPCVISKSELETTAGGVGLVGSLGRLHTWTLDEGSGRADSPQPPPPFPSHEHALPPGLTEQTVIKRHWV
jgi:hypothetical protein